MKKTKKIISILLSIALMLSNFAFADSGSDIKGHWAEHQVNDWILKGYVRGFDDGSIKPDSEISRIEFVVMVNRAFGFTETDNISFKDVKAKDWFYSEVAKAKKAGYITGFSDGTFKPNGKISRQEAALILARLFKLEAPSNTDVLADLKDSSNIADWSVDAVRTVVSKGYMQGMPDKRFLPSKSMSRAEAIVTLGRCYLDYVKAAYDKSGIYTAGTVEGSVEIKAADVTLRDTVINGDLIINESVGDGNVWLKNVTVKGDTFVRGGGLNSIVAEDSAFKLVIIDKADNKVRFVTAGNTVVDSVDMKSGGKLEEQGLSGSGIATITISRDNLSSDPIILVGKFDVVDVKTANTVINVSGDIEELKVASAADNTSISLSAESKVKNLVIDALAVVTGAGKIETAQINVSGTKVEAPVATVKVADGVTNVVANAEANSPISTTVTPVTSAPSTPSTPSVSAPNAYIFYSQEVVLGVDSTMEYTTDNWATKSDITGTSINLAGIIPSAGSSSKQMKIRYKAATSAEKILTITARQATPTYAIDFINEQINNVSSDDQYSDNNFISLRGYMSGPNWKIVPDIQRDIYIRKAAPGGSFKSLVQHIVIPTRPKCPLVGDGTGNTFKVQPASGTMGVKVTAQPTLEISVMRSDLSTKTPWEAGVAEGKEYTNTVPTDFVNARFKATDTSFAGEYAGIKLSPTNCKVSAAPVPIITSVTIPAKDYKIGDTVTLTITADGSGYTGGIIKVNGVDVSNSFASAGGNDYTISYPVAEYDMDRASVDKIPISIVLYNQSTPCSPYTTAPTSSGTVTIDAHKPNMPSISYITSTNNGVDGDGKSYVNIYWTDSNSVDIDHYEIIAKQGSTPQYTDRVDGLSNIAPGVQHATLEWTSGAELQVGIVAYDRLGQYISTSSSYTVLADGVTNADIATNLVINDKNQNNDGSDLQVQFSAAADESTINEYRIIVTPSSSAVAYSLSSVNAVPSGRYKPVAKTGSSTYSIDFNSNDVDTDGRAIHTGVFYEVFILSVADGSKATINSLSVRKYGVILYPYITTSMIAGAENASKFKIIGQGDYSDHIFGAGSVDLIDSTGHPRWYFKMISSNMYYTLNSTNPNLEVGDQITVTDDGTGVITISLINADNDNSLDGSYTLDIKPIYWGPVASVTFTISGSNILVTGTN